MVDDGESLRFAEARNGEGAGKQWARTVAHRCSGKSFHFGSIDRTPGRCVARTRRAAERNPEPETSGGGWKNPPRDGDLSARSSSQESRRIHKDWEGHVPQRSVTSSGLSSSLRGT